MEGWARPQSVQPKPARPSSGGLFVFSPQFPFSTLLHCFLTLCWFAFLPFRPWDDETLGQAYNILLEELALPPSAPGGKVEFRRSLTLSLLFKFYLEVLHKLKAMVKRIYFKENIVQGSVVNPSDLNVFLQNVITDEVPEKIQPLPREIQPGLQEFQVRKCLSEWFNSQTDVLSS